MLPFKEDSFRWVTMQKRPITDSVASAICHGLFTRFPKLKVATIENGGSWVPQLLEQLAEAYKMMPQTFAEHPVTVFRRNVYVNPFFEDDAPALIEAVGADHVLFGSDFPHPEGLARPCSYAEHMKQRLNAADLQKIMGGNLGQLLGVAGMVA
jgi:predicted TIM-barrel fold metal-dependent hydrolase